MSSRIDRARGLLQRAQLKALGAGKPNATNRLLKATYGQLSAIIRKAARAATSQKNKPATISPACREAVDQRINAVEQRILGLRTQNKRRGGGLRSRR